MTSTMLSSILLAQGGEAEMRGDLVDALAAYSAAVSDPDPHVVAEATFRLGRVAWRQARYDDALHYYGRAAALAAQIGDADVRASATNGIGAIHCERGDYAAARATYQGALELATSDTLRAKVLLNLGVIANIQGDWSEALELYDRAAAMLEQGEGEAGLALALHNKAMLLADRRDWDAAEETFARCLAACERTGDRQTMANVLLNRAELLCGRGHPAAALESCEQAMSHFLELGDAVGRAEALRWMARALADTGDRAAAVQRLREGVRSAARLQRPLLEAECSRDLGAIALDESDLTEARRWLTRALDRFVSLGAARDAAEVREMLARVQERAPRS
ncbi:MAG TPA: tetratricopeptide repeat protein [Gemmatimonadaceae bacterium]|nr:tetratricopeptide repeat protein [Gemmatimonadaceae bacterium]